MNEYQQPLDESGLDSPSANQVDTPTQTTYRRQTPHISQEPIDDVEPQYVTRERYQTLEQARGNRRHMGTATSDPDYLTPVNNGARGRAKAPVATGQQKTLHYERYLQTPKGGKSIFVSRQERARKRNRRILIGLVALIVVVVVILVVFVL